MDSAPFHVWTSGTFFRVFAEASSIWCCENSLYVVSSHLANSRQVEALPVSSRGTRC